MNFYNKNYFTQNRIANFLGFLKELFDDDDSEVWKEAIESFRYLA